MIILDKQGVSIVGTIFTLMILGVMGIGLVSLIANEQSSRTQHMQRDRAFYAVQAGFEYALREIVEGGYPIVQNLAFADSQMTTTIDPTNNNAVSVTSKNGSATKTYTIDAPVLAGQCIFVDNIGASLGGESENIIQNTNMQRQCLNALRIASMQLSWTPEAGEKTTRIQIAGADVYNDESGVGLESAIDITDTRFVDPTLITAIEFNSNMRNKLITLQLHFTDASTYTAGSFFFP